MGEKSNWLICGTSPFAMSRLGAIDYGKFTTVALNWFPVKCDYRFIVDCGFVDKMYKDGKKLSCINSVCEPAIEYAYKQGAKNIILFGVDLGEDFQPKEQTDVTKAIIKRYGNVYTLNKEAEIGVPLWTEINLN